MKNYKIFRSVYEKKYLKNPLDVSVVDLLTDRKDGCHLKIIIEPRDDFEKEIVKKGEIITKWFALNYGPHGDPSYMYRTTVIDPGNEKTYQLDNAFDNKCFGLIPNANLYSIWGEARKVFRQFTFQGNPEELFKEFKLKGYSFLEQEVNNQDYEERIERIKQHLKENKIYRSDLNPSQEEN